MTSVSSSNISAIGYDGTTSSLWVRFHHGFALYEYRGVPSSVYEAFLRASSKGAFFARMIKGVYRYRRAG